MRRLHVLIDGAPARSCITYAVACDGAVITTVEGLHDEVSVELRNAFSREHALQCGFCTPGMLVSARDAVLRLPEPDQREIRVLMSGNLCRCTGYVGVVRAVQSVIADRRARGIAPEPGGGIAALGPAGSAHPAGSQTSSARVRTQPRAEPTVSARRESRPLEEWRPHVTMEQSFTVRFILLRQSGLCSGFLRRCGLSRCEELVGSADGRPCRGPTARQGRADSGGVFRLRRYRARRLPLCRNDPGARSG